MRCSRRSRFSSQMWCWWVCTINFRIVCSCGPWLLVLVFVRPGWFRCTSISPSPKPSTNIVLYFGIMSIKLFWAFWTWSLSGWRNGSIGHRTKIFYNWFMSASFVVKCSQNKAIWAAWTGCLQVGMIYWGSWVIACIYYWRWGFCTWLPSRDSGISLGKLWKVSSRSLEIIS